MGLLDNLSNTLGGAIGSAASSALPSIIEQIFPGGLQGLLNQLSQSGYGKQVNSWLGRGENQPISVDDLRTVLTSSNTKLIAEKLGIPYDQVLAVLSALLPQVVDQHSPNGQLQVPPPAQGGRPA